ncbi:serine hydrolase [Sphingomonas sp. ACRSK]|uniref:serine hydrolase n=1 Tax=Sphingomonas sp. ACRSK TaxID=2918213 RepID=UPI001EF50359|nr:serine hydrolase [Sphingomonas sp. ACRSK]MCG7347532.1 class A beta-lactamase-related serine hydrolase [Sphingomonas sp. ACRSK]
MPLAAQEAPAPAPEAQAVTASPELRQRAEALAAAITGNIPYDRYFAPSFRAAIPEAAFRQVRDQLTGGFGKPTRLEALVARTPHVADFRLGFERGTAVGQIVVDPAAPHLVTGLRITGSEPREAPEASIQAVVDAIRALPGATGFALARLEDGGPVRLAAHDPATPLAIGSTFKLVILAELVRATAAGERRWDDMVTLDGSPLPAGGYTSKPAGTRVSLRELATQMISVSDNSATDILLRALGRDKVEAMLPVIGIRDARGRNTPFLGTLEAFKLKGVEGGALGQQWEAADVAGRRALLDGAVAQAPVSAIPTSLFQDGKPIRIATVEWFASADDLLRVMDWLRRNTEGPAGAEARAVLSKNPGIAPANAARWDWVGYKGGSEPGVINMTLLMRAKSGGWVAMAGSWNNPQAAIDEARFVGLINKAAALAAP